MIEDALLEPYRVIWELLPPELAMVMFGFMILVSLTFVVRIGGFIEEDAESETLVGGYHPDRGYKYNPEDFD